MGWLKGQPVGVGMYTAPSDGVTEIAGLAMLEPFRTRGIATRLTALAVHRAMAQGAEVVCLTAADERAGRVAEIDCDTEQFTILESAVGETRK